MASVGLLLLRYGEIGLKGQNRIDFSRKLRQNVRRCLAANGVEGKVWQEGQRLYLETDQVDAALEAVQRVFGIVSLSPVQVVAPAGLEAIAAEAVALARRAGLGAGRSVCVRARRSDKSFRPISPEIERQVGAAVVEATGARVDLSGAADLEIGVEVQAGRALVFGQVIPGPGGLPVGSQGRVVALLSSGIDSPVAVWLMLKRGCSVTAVHLSNSPAQTEQVRELVNILDRYAYGRPVKLVVLSHEELVGPVLDRLRSLRAGRWACLFCKRAMLQRAAAVAEEAGASALVTGDSLGQVASQTLSNLEAISYGIVKPILRPLIGLDKTEIVALARQIGTYDASTQEAVACRFVPASPLIQAGLPKLQALLEALDAADPAFNPDSAGRRSMTEPSPEPEGRSEVHA